MENMIFGKNPVLEALRSGRPINKVLIAEGLRLEGGLGEIIELARKGGVPFERLDKKLLDKKCGGGVHQGVAALASPKEYVDASDILSIAKARSETPFIILLDGIEDPHNLGAIIRTAEAAGAHGIIIPKRRAAPVTEVVSKTSAGAVEHLAVARTPNLRNEIKSLKEDGVWVVGVEGSAEKKYTEADLTLPTAIVIGSEGKGLSKHVKEDCEMLVSIPMKGKVSSLNASVAASIVMYEVVRQRAKCRGKG